MNYKLKNINKLKDLIIKNYIRFISLGLFLYSVFSLRFSVEYGLCILIFALAISDADKDIVEVNWSEVFYKGIPLMLIPIIFWKFFPPIWNKIVYLELGSSPHLFNLNELFKSLPFNDGSFARIFKPMLLTRYMRFVYGYGFALPVIIPVIRSFIAKDLRKMTSYILSSHILQFFLIAPFYLTIHLDEVWYVLGHADGMARNLSPDMASIVVVNCFPSMHTSVAFAMLLLAIREKGKVYKITWIIFCSSIIYSTMYLEIHWVLDVIAGMILGWASVKLGNVIINKIPYFNNRYPYDLSKSIDRKNAA